MARLATIDLDWLEEEIEAHCREANNAISKPSRDYWSTTLGVYKMVRIKCTMIEPPTTETDSG